MKRKRLVVLGIAMLLVACSGKSTTTSSQASTTRKGGSGPVSTVAAATTTLAPRSPDTAVIAPDSVAGLPLGATKDQVTAVLGQPAATTTGRDVQGEQYDILRYQFNAPQRGLSLSFRARSQFSPGLTDWTVNAAGPSTAAGIQVGDPVAKVTSAYGDLQAFCCQSKVGSLTQRGGRLVVLVGDDTQTVSSITGGEEAAWTRSVPR